MDVSQSYVALTIGRASISVGTLWLESAILA